MYLMSKQHWVREGEGENHNEVYQDILGETKPVQLIQLNYCRWLVFGVSHFCQCHYCLVRDVCSAQLS